MTEKEKKGPRKGGSYIKDPESGELTLKERTQPPKPKKHADIPAKKGK